MLSTVSLEVMNTINPEFNWNRVMKGKRSRKSTARTPNSGGKASNCNISPERFGDNSGSDSDKVGETVLGELAADKDEPVPLKKRRHFLRSPSPKPYFLSLYHKDTSSPQTHPCSRSSEGQGQVAVLNSSPGQRSLMAYSNWQLREIDGPEQVKSHEDFDNVALPNHTGTGYYYPGDFSGIELLAAAASMDVDESDGDKEDRVVEDSSTPKHSDIDGFAELSGQSLNFNESGNCSSNAKAGDNAGCFLSLNNSSDASQVHSGGSKVKTPPRSPHLKVDRRNWDLNTVMDAWDQTYDDAITEHSLKDVSNVQLEDKAASIVQMRDNASGTGVEFSPVKSEENTLEAVLSDRTRFDLELTCFNYPLDKKADHSLTNDGREKSNLAFGKDANENNAISCISSGADFETLVKVMNVEAAALSSSSCKPHCSSGMLASEEKIKIISGSVLPIMQDDDRLLNAGGSDRTTVSGRFQTRDQDETGVDNKPGSDRDVTHGDEPDIEMSQSAINVKNKNVENPQETSEPPGTLNQDGRPVAIVDSSIGSDGAYVAYSTLHDCKGHFEVAEIITKCENSNLPNEESQTCSPVAQGDEATTSVGKVGSNIDDCGGLDVSPDEQGDMVDGNDLNRFQDGCDSPYEDGELRGLCLYPWVENEVENDCVDYESDGRNGDGSDAAGYPGFEIVEGGYEDSCGIERRRPFARRFPEGYGSKNGLVKNPISLRKCFVKDYSDNAIGGKKDSNGGSGTTVEESMEMVTEANDGGLRRRHFSDRRDFIHGKVGEYSRMSRGKLQSCLEGRSLLDGPDGKDTFFIQRCRTRRFGGSYSRPARDVGPDKYLGRYNRPARHISEGDADQGMAYWGSRSRHTSGYQGAESRNHCRPRTITGDSGPDFRDDTSNISKRFHRPFIRGNPPAGRPDCFDVSRWGPLTRGGGSYRSRGGRRPHNGSWEFREDFDSVPGDTAASVRLSRYFSRKERSFSPRGGAYFPLNRRRSRSRSRTRSPKPWHSNRERNFVNRRQSRSPDFRSGDKKRMSSKPGFQVDYGGEGYMSPPPRGRFSPHRRWGCDDRNFADNDNLRRRRSPDGRIFRRNLRVSVDSGGLKSGENLRHMMRPARFTFMNDEGADDSRECSKVDTKV